MQIYVIFTTQHTGDGWVDFGFVKAFRYELDAIKFCAERCGSDYHVGSREDTQARDVEFVIETTTLE